MSKYTLDELKFLDNSMSLNMQGLLSNDWFNPFETNYGDLAEYSRLAALALLEEKRTLKGASTKTSKSTKIDLPIEEIVNLFNENLPELQKVTKITDSREKSITKILSVFTLEDIGNVINNTKESDYLKGNVVKWKASFDWIFDSDNFVKILEGNYDNLKLAKDGTSKYTASDSIKEKIANGLFS